MQNKTTQYGFNFGSMKVSRICGDEKTGVHVVGIETRKNNIDVRATKTGQLRFFVGEQECELVDKGYVKQLEDYKKLAEMGIRQK